MVFLLREQFHYVLHVLQNTMEVTTSVYETTTD